VYPEGKGEYDDVKAAEFGFGQPDVTKLAVEQLAV